jgi:hypothetical protein
MPGKIPSSFIAFPVHGDAQPLLKYNLVAVSAAWRC